jgi:hypothetical protein
MLIHAAGAVDASEMVTRHSGKMLHSLALNLSATPDNILGQVRVLAHRIGLESARAAAA